MRRGSAIVLGLVAFFLGGCGGAAGERDVHTVRTRASFEFSCPEDQIQTTVLESYAGWERPNNAKHRQIGVEGCGRRAVYVHDMNSGWMMNSASTAAASE